MNERTTAANWFETRDRFVQVCADANSQASREWDQEFAADQIDKARKYGLDTFISAKQIKHLCRIADIDIPPFIPTLAPQSRSQATMGRRSGSPAERHGTNGSHWSREEGDPGAYDDDIPF